MGTDSTEQGRIMWARVKGKTENALLRLPFKSVYLFRPAFIRPLHGMKSKTKIYRIMYAISAPLFPLLNVIFPHSSEYHREDRTRDDQCSRCVAIRNRVLETPDINGAAT